MKCFRTKFHYPEVKVLLILFFLFPLSNIFALPVNSIYVNHDFALSTQIEDFPWNLDLPVYSIKTDWQGNKVEPYWETQIKSVWTDNYLYVLFVANYDTLSFDRGILPDALGDSFNIWNHDVVEMFIGDNPDPKKYYEFVASALGQKIDIRHNKNLEKAESFFTDYTSGWSIRVNIEKKKKRWTCQFKIPISSISSEPVEQGKEFNVNFYRCSGDEYKNKDKRRYMALSPTYSSNPSFHVPERFTKLILKKKLQPIPEPLIVIDFEGRQKTVKGPAVSPLKLKNLNQIYSAGIAASDCADIWRTRKSDLARPVTFNDNILKRINGVSSFTVAGWIRRENTFSDPNYGATNQYILNCPGRFHIFLDKWQRLACRAYTGDDNKLVEIWSSWFASNHLNPGDRWVFFAVTYDSKSSKQNAKVYIGTEKYSVNCDNITDVPGGPIAASELTELIIGAYDKKGNGILRGMIDHLSIYVSDNDRKSVAFSESEIERIRNSNLGSKWITKIQLQNDLNERKNKQKQKMTQNRFWSGSINLHPVPVDKHILYTTPPEPLKEKVKLSVPTGQKIPLQFAASSTITGSWDIKVSNIKELSGKEYDFDKDIYYIKHVLVEANNNGGIRTSLTSRPPKRWQEYQIAKAPFKVAEVLIPVDEVTLKENPHQPQTYHSILVDIEVPRNTPKGVYRGTVSLTSGNEIAESEFNFEVFDVDFPDNYKLQSYHWFMPEPDNLIFDKPFKWWSSKHWKMIENSMSTLREFGQDVINIPLLDRGMHAPIRTIQNKKGEFEFDFTIFDRYFRLALKKGFKRIAGTHILWLPRMGSSSVDHNRYNGVYFWNSNLKNPEILFPAKYDEDKWLEFIPVFYKALYRHLEKNGWKDYYIQQQYDEPSNLDKYKSLSQLTRKYMPGVKTIDAIKTKPEFSPFVDIMVFGITLLRADAQKLAAERLASDKEVWFYHCASPYPPYPNRHLDDPLTSSRLYPWLAFIGKSQGYLWWACNVYRGANPYETSIGPLPGGSQNPGHGPGDNWMYYPGPNGLRSSMRMVAFREGLIDHTLLKMLEKENPDKAAEITKKIAIDPVTYSTNSYDYYQAREELLSSLSN